VTLELWAVVFQAITAVAIIFAGWQLLYHSKAMHRDLEMAYVSRYWQLMDGRSPQFVLSRKPSKVDQAVIARYLQLCEDEVELRSLGRVTDDTWRFWAKSIHAQVSAQSYRDALAAAPADELVFLRELMLSGPDHDPLKRLRVKRWLRGL
jgi:hypothetical protein